MRLGFQVGLGCALALSLVVFETPTAFSAYVSDIETEQTQPGIQRLKRPIIGLANQNEILVTDPRKNEQTGTIFFGVPDQWDRQPLIRGPR